MNAFAIDTQRCHKDGICAEVCPIGIVIQESGGAVPSPAEDAAERCIKCGHCVAACPHGAISLETMKPENCLPVRRELEITPEQSAYHLMSRRSARAYREAEVEREKMTAILDAARYAPTAGNGQKVEWIVINSREKVREFAGLIADMMRHMIKENHPLSAKYRLPVRVASWEAGKDGILRGAPALVVAHAPSNLPLAQVDCSVALTFLELAAKPLGLGACWAGFFMLAVPQWRPLQEALHLPEGHSCFGAMMIGYPKYRFFRIPERKDAVVTWM